jgi:hypothetical protein
MMRAATLAAQAEQVLADPAATVNDKIRIDGAARRARLDMQAVLQPERDQRVMGLGDILRQRARP